MIKLERGKIPDEVCEELKRLYAEIANYLVINKICICFGIRLPIKINEQNVIGLCHYVNEREKRKEKSIPSKGQRMNILIIGNGFDLAHGLPTKYADF